MTLSDFAHWFSTLPSGAVLLSAVVAIIVAVIALFGVLVGHAITIFNQFQTMKRMKHGRRGRLIAALRGLSYAMGTSAAASSSTNGIFAIMSLGIPALKELQAVAVDSETLAVLNRPEQDALWLAVSTASINVEYAKGFESLSRDSLSTLTAQRAPLESDDVARLHLQSIYYVSQMRVDEVRKVMGDSMPVLELFERADSILNFLAATYTGENYPK
jgi:hypothetical protein